MQFGAIHGREDAWCSSRETFERFGPGATGTEVDLDELGADHATYGCRHSVVTRAVPACGANDVHESMAPDACLARAPAGTPALAPSCYDALAVRVPAAP